MAIEEFYATIDGNLEDVRMRLLSDDRIARFVGIFTQDPTYSELTAALETGDMAAAFRAAHTMKGLASNLGFTRLLDAADDLTEALRPDASGNPSSPDEVGALASRVAEAYDQVVQATSLV